MGVMQMECADVPLPPPGEALQTVVPAPPSPRVGSQPLGSLTEAQLSQSQVPRNQHDELRIVHDA